jgi:hypothetical protein
MQERVRLDLDDHLIAAARNRDFAQVATRRMRLAGNRAKRAEVVLAEGNDSQQEEARRLLAEIR